MPILYCVLLFLFLFLIEICYLKFAGHYNIIDRPNHRSSHQNITIRGGGIIFPLSIFLFSVFNHFQYPYFTIGLFCISLISFLDDLYTLNNKVRLLVHMLSVTLILTDLQIYNLPWLVIVATILLIMGTINAYNFMDGINGMTVAYSFITIMSLYYINLHIVHFIQNELIIYPLLSIVVFGIFNFRSRAKSFAGDVGSVSIAFIVIFLLLSLIVKTGNFAYILLLLVYGLDTVTTIGFRLIRKENIFQAHRSHFYQYIANTCKFPHLYISSAYGLIQLLINILLIKISFTSSTGIAVVIFAAGFGLVGLRFATEGLDKLIKKYD